MTSSPWVVRAARSEDDEGIRKLSRLCGLKVDPEQQRALSQARLWVSCALEPKVELSGFVLVWIVSDEVELIDLGVGPNFRRRGLARALLAQATREAYRAGARSMFLEVRATNEPARALYEACGFEIGGRRRAYYGDGEDALLYSCCLSGPV